MTLMESPQAYIDKLLIKLDEAKFLLNKAISILEDLPELDKDMDQIRVNETIQDIEKYLEKTK